MLNGRKDSRGNIINDGSIKNWFGTKQDNLASPNKGDDQSWNNVPLNIAKKSGSNICDNLLADCNFTAKRKTTVFKGNLSVNFEPHNTWDKENELPERKNSQKMTKTEVRSYASKIKQRVAQSEGYQPYRNNYGNKFYNNKGNKFWADKRKLQAEIAQTSKYDMKVMKKKFDSIIKSNQKQKDNTADLIDISSKPICKYSKQTELSFINLNNQSNSAKINSLTPVIEIEDCSNEPQIWEYFEVERVLGRRIKKNPETGLYYLIKWKNLELKDATWEHISNLTHAKDKLLEFENFQEVEGKQEEWKDQRKRDVKEISKLIETIDSKTQGFFIDGDKAKKIEIIFLDQNTKELMATVEWKRKKGEKILKPTNYKIEEIKLFDPDILLDYYESKIIVKND